MAETLIIDAQMFDGRPGGRAEFRLPDIAVGSSIRIGELGALVAPGAGGDSVRFPITSGIWSLIERITLYADDNTVLDEVYQPYELMGFLNTLDSSPACVSKSALLKTSYGFGLDADQTPGKPTLANSFQFEAPLKTYCGFGAPITQVRSFSTTVGNTLTGEVDLRDVLPLLKAISYFPGHILKNSRLVLEFNPEPTGNGVFFTLNSDLTVYGDALTGWSAIRPIMMVELAPQITQPDFSVQFPAWRWDQAYVGAAAVNVQTYKMKSFEGKFVSRMLLIHDYPATNALQAVLGLVDAYSPALNETLAVYNQGRTVVPYKGLTQSNRLGMCTDTFGRQTLPFGSHLISTVQTDPKFFQQIDPCRHTAGNLAYYGFEINALVDNLQIEINRLATMGVGWLDAAHVLMAYAQVVRQIVVKGGQVSVSE